MNERLSKASQFPESSTMRAIGIETLRRMNSVKTYNDWCYQLVEPYIGSHVLEVGCGIGNMTSYFARRERLVAVDILPEAVELVGRQYDDKPHVQVILGDICAEDVVASLGEQSFDSCVSFNVLEHIEDDALALYNMARLLKPGGVCAMIIPGCDALYGTLDSNLGHYRRYTPKMLHHLARQARLETVRASWMNFPGMFGWFLSARVMRRQLLPQKQLRVFNLLAPLFQRLEARWQPPIGQSVLFVGIKRA